MSVADSMDAAPADGPVNPWPGLTSYTEEDRSRFFGREDEIHEVIRYIERETLTVLFGRSGLGKTSLLCAGAMPRLREQGYLPVLVRIDHSPEAPSPVEQVKGFTRQACSAAGIEWTWLGTPPPDNATLWEFFASAQLWGTRNDLVSPVLIFDQFEEAFTIGRGHPRTREFFEQLADLAENRLPAALRDHAIRSGERIAVEGRKATHRLLISLREDYVCELDSLRTLMPAIMRNRLGILALDREKAVGVVLGPGRTWISQAVAETIVNAAAGAVPQTDRKDGPHSLNLEVEPAYLSVMCHELFRNMLASGRTVITADAVVQEQGGILDALYERSFAGLDPRVRHFVEDHLLTTSGFRSTLPVAEALREGLTSKDIGTLVNRRLLRMEDRLGTRHVEISHNLLAPVAKASRERRQADQKLEQERVRTEALLAERKAARRRQRLLTALAIGLGAIIVGLLYLGHYCFFKERVAYYGNVTKRWGNHVGLDERTLEQVRHNACSYKLTSKGVRWIGTWPELNPPHRLEAVNALLKPTTNCGLGTYLWWPNQEDKEMAANQNTADLGLDKQTTDEVGWDNYGNIAYGRGLDVEGKVLYEFVYSPLSEDAKTWRLARFVGPDGFSQLQRDSAAEYVRMEYDNEGWEKRVLYLDSANRPARGPKGAFGRRFEHDELGRVTLQVSIDAVGNPMIDSGGNSAMRAVYDGNGNSIERHSLGQALKPMVLGKGWAVAKNVYDSWGRVVRETYWDDKDRPVKDKEGFHEVGLDYDGQGNTVTVTFFGLDGKPTFGSLTYASIRRIFDKDTGRMLRATVHGTSGENLLGLDGLFHGYEYEYDARGRILQDTKLGVDQQPVQTALVAGITKKTYDDMGNLVAERFYEPNGEKAAQNDGTHGWDGSYDGASHLLSKTWLGLDEKPRIPNGHWYATERNEYDARGNRIRQMHFGPNDEPVQDEGQCGWKAEFDDRSNKITETWLDKSGKPVNRKFATIIWAYNSSRLETEARYFKADGTPGLNADLVHRVTKSYNVFGHVVEYAAWGARGEPAVDSDGVHRYTFAYDQDGNEAECAYWGISGGPALTRSTGIHKLVRVWNKTNGRLERTAYFGLKDEPVLSNGGHHAHVSTHDDQGRTTSEMYEGLDGQPVRAFGQGAGFRNEYDAKNNVSRRTFVTPAGEPAIQDDGSYGWEATYDETGGKTSHTWLGEDGRPTRISAGYARMQTRYVDDASKEGAYFGIKGEPVVTKAGYHRWVLKNGKDGADKGKQYFDLQGRSVRVRTVIAVASVIGGEAKRLGLRAGDILWSYGGERFLRDDQWPGLEAAVKLVEDSWKRPRKHLSLVISRDGRLMTFTFRPGEKIGIGQFAEQEVGEDFLKAAGVK